jgi:hypothetical protein
VYKGNGQTCAQVSCVQPGTTCLDTLLTGATYLQPGAFMFFDVTVTNTVTIRQLKMYVGEGAGTAFGASVYTAPGGNWAAHWAVPGDWTLVATGAGSSIGLANTASNVTLVAPFTLAPGTYAMAVATDSRATPIYLSNGATATYSDANIALSLGGVSGGFTVGLQPRIWNGSLCYGPATASCYANCDSSTAVPFLNVADFTCFLTKFAAGDPYANCDNSTTVPTLNVADFTCFLTKFAAGCSAP